MFNYIVNLIIFLINKIGLKLGLKEDETNSLIN